MCESAPMLALEIYGGALMLVTRSGTALRMRWMRWCEVGLGAEDMLWLRGSGVLGDVL